MDTFQYSAADLELFSAASGDRNPLHLSREYASRTSYGAQVVFGALGAVAALGGVPAEQGRRIRGMQIDFLRPMFVGVDYRVQTTPQDSGILARLFDGTSTVVSAALKIGTEWPQQASTAPNGGIFPCHEALTREAGDLVPGLAVQGRYQADHEARTALRRRWNVHVPGPLLDMLLWSSYLIGMELPGKTALFSKFSVDTVGDPADTGGFDYRATVDTIDKRLGQLRIRAQLSRDGSPIASAECRAFNRPSAPVMDPALLSTELPPSGALAGKRALVIGASRGLGAALAHGLASQGVKVIAVSRSDAGASSESIHFVKGDAADATWRDALRRKIASEYGGLDLLLLNAFPSLLPLLLEDNTCGRIEEYISRAVAMTVGPLCTFLPTLEAAKGTAVLISSMAVEQPVKEWPHYVAAKRAAEALAEVAAQQYPEVGVLTVRPERLLTEMTNTPLGRRGALAPEIMAARIVRRLQQGVSGLEIMRAQA